MTSQAVETCPAVVRVSPDEGATWYPAATELEPIQHEAGYFDFAPDAPSAIPSGRLLVLYGNVDARYVNRESSALKIVLPDRPAMMLPPTYELTRLLLPGASFMYAPDGS
jgi:hypothetical protein